MAGGTGPRGEGATPFTLRLKVPEDEASVRFLTRRQSAKKLVGTAGGAAASLGRAAVTLPVPTSVPLINTKSWTLQARRRCPVGGGERSEPPPTGRRRLRP